MSVTTPCRCSYCNKDNVCVCYIFFYIITKSKPISISSSYIIIEITSTLDFHVNQIEKNRDSLNTILSEIFGNGVSFKVQKGVEKENKSSGIDIKGNTPDSENDEQVRDKVVDLFDGEIIT